MVQSGPCRSPRAGCRGAPCSVESPPPRWQHSVVGRFPTTLGCCAARAFNSSRPSPRAMSTGRQRSCERDATSPSSRSASPSRTNSSAAARWCLPNRWRARSTSRARARHRRTTPRRCSPCPTSRESSPSSPRTSTCGSPRVVPRSWARPRHRSPPWGRARADRAARRRGGRAGAARHVPASDAVAGEEAHVRQHRELDRAPPLSACDVRRLVHGPIRNPGGRARAPHRRRSSVRRGGNPHRVVRTTRRSLRLNPVWNAGDISRLELPHFGSPR